MVDPEADVEPARLDWVRRRAVEERGFIYDPTVVARVQDSIVARIRRGAVGEGLTHADLVRDAGAPSWVAHHGLMGHVLDLVSVAGYEADGVLLSALVRAHEDDVPPTDGFCRLLEDLGLVRSRHDRDGCLEVWDIHWKLAVMRLDRSADDRSADAGRLPDSDRVPRHRGRGGKAPVRSG